MAKTKNDAEIEAKELADDLERKKLAINEFVEILRLDMIASLNKHHGPSVGNYFPEISYSDEVKGQVTPPSKGWNGGVHETRRKSRTYKIFIYGTE